MIRIVTAARLERLGIEASEAREHARRTSGAAHDAFGRHVRELYKATGRAERAETVTAEVGVLLAGAVAELSVAQQEILLKDLEIRRLREELRGGPRAGDPLAVLLHHGEPVAVYACREDAFADTATHGFPPDHPWKPCDERPASAFIWRCETFTYNPASNGFHRAGLSVPRALGGAA
ncbi:hypothetical protein [Streptomyces sp. NPDC000983]|uniref:hypothetical protein n=1 Tax=Streptomyces sp. NPDC000983 TaxID=3154373 RepID=UPI00331D9713